MNHRYRQTLYASYIGYITQAIINNLAPLLFVTFISDFSISLEQIGFMVTMNFGIQMLVDFLSAKYVDKIGYRVSIVAAHIFSAVGLIGLGTFPFIFADPYAGLLVAVGIYAIGGGLIEVLISPIVQALPTEQKSAAMSLLHSFYCWGHVGVVVLATLYFVTVGIENWRYLPLIMAIVPIFNTFLFAKVPIIHLSENVEIFHPRKLFTMKLFWIFFILMICSGAAEQAMSQWASLFAETGLKVSKTVGDLLGPCLFAISMGITRVVYSKYGQKIELKKFIAVSSAVCIGSYLLAVFSPLPILSLLGCGLCGLSVGILWPGVFSLSSSYCPQGGTAMFAFLALAGDVGCAGGPLMVGTVSDWFGGNLKIGLLFAILFPALVIVFVFRLRKQRRADLKAAAE